MWYNLTMRVDPIPLKVSPRLEGMDIIQNMYNIEC